MDYSTKIYNLRKKEDISQEALAAIVGTTRQQVSRWECGSAVPNPKYSYALAAHFGCTLEELYGEKIESDSNEDVKDKSSLHFGNFALIISIIALISFYSMVLLGYFSDQVAHYLHKCFGAVREGGVEYNPVDMNLSIRYFSESICAIGVAWTIVISILLITLLVLTFVHYMKNTNNKIARADYYPSFIAGFTFVLSSLIAGVMMLTVGQHVGFDPEGTFDLIGGTIMLLGALFLSDVVVTLINIISRSALKKVLILTPWSGGKKIFEIVYVAVGLAASTWFIGFNSMTGSMAYIGFFFSGLFYFPLATVLLLIHFFTCYCPFGKKEA